MIKFPGTEEFTDTLSRYFGSPNVEKTRTITFQITDDCNLCCSYCYQINKGHHKMPFEIAKTLIDELLHNDKLIENYVKLQYNIFSMAVVILHIFLFAH